MSNDTDRPAKRGEARWKEVREGVAKSNEDARHAARESREAFDRVRMEARARARQELRGD